MDMNRYTFKGYYAFNEQIISVEGNMKVTPVHVDETYSLEGIIFDSHVGKREKAKGYLKAQFDENDNLLAIAMIIMNSPTKKGFLNIMYGLTNPLPKFNDADEIIFDGEYIGDAYHSVSAKIIEQSIYDDFVDKNIADFHFTEIIHPTEAKYTLKLTFTRAA